MKHGRKKYLLLLCVGALILLSGLLYSCAAQRALDQEVADAPRNSETGVVTGTEAITLTGAGGKACLLVHGWVGSRIDFNELGERLQALGFTVRLMRLPGHGTTPQELETMDVDDLLAGVRDEFQALRKEYGQVDLIGFSLGGALSTLLATEGEVHRLVLVAPFFDVTYKWYYLLSPETWNDMLQPFVRYVIKSKRFVRVNRREAVPHIYSYQVIPTRAVEVLCNAGARARDPECLCQVTCPVLLVHALGDMAASPDAAQDAFDLMKSEHKEVEWFEDSNHHLLWDFDGLAAIHRIERFLAGD